MILMIKFNKLILVLKNKLHQFKSKNLYNPIYLRKYRIKNKLLELRVSKVFRRNLREIKNCKKMFKIHLEIQKLKNRHLKAAE